MAMDKVTCNFDYVLLSHTCLLFNHFLYFLLQLVCHP